MQNTLNKLQRDTDITWFTQTTSYVHKEISSPFISIQKYEGIQPIATPLHFLFTLSQYLSHNHIDCLQYNTIPYTTVLQCLSFIGEIPWENTTVNPIPWVYKNVGQKTSKTHVRVYSKPGVQTWLNNIFESGRSGSTTNNISLEDWSQQIHHCCTCWTML